MTGGIEKWRYERAFASFLVDHPRQASVIIKGCFHNQIPIEELPDLILLNSYRLSRMKHVGLKSVRALQHYVHMHAAIIP